MYVYSIFESIRKYNLYQIDLILAIIA